MKIEFKSVIPLPMKNEFIPSGDLWGKEVVFNSSENSVIDASSGKGKSTFTAILAGIRNDFEGQVLFDEININQFSKSEWTEIRKCKLSFVFQDLQLFDKLTVKENLLLKNKLTDFKEEKEILEILTLFGLENKWTQECGKLSLGQQQRIAIIRSFLQPADFLIMDEPFSHLDDNNTQIAFTFLKNHCFENNIGVILTTLGNQYANKWDQTIQIG